MIDRGIAVLRERPRHVILAAALGALVLGPRSWPAVVLLAALGALVVTTSGAMAVVVLVVVGSAVVGSARLQAYDATPLRDWIGHAVRASAELTGPPQRRAWGGWQAPVALTGRWDGVRVQLRARPGTPVPKAGTGAIVAVVGGLRALTPKQAYLRVRGIGAVLHADRVVDRGATRGGWSGVVDGLRRRARDALTSAVPRHEGALLVGMVLGDANGLGEDDADDLQTAGLTHLVAASGANVALLVAFVFLVGAAAGLPSSWRIWGGLAAIAVYVPLAGAGPSIQRAGVMGAATLVAIVAGRPGTRWYALLLAAFVTLLANPRAMEDPGWQLSFVAVVAILLGAAPLGRAFRGRRVPGPVADVCAVTLVATLATAPLLAWHFDRTSLVSLPANLLVAPLVAPVMWLGFGAALVGVLAASAAAPLAMLAALPAAAILAVGRTAAEVPGATITASPAVVAAGAAAVALAVVAAVVRPDGRRGRRARIGAVSAAAVLMAVLGVGAFLGTTGRPAPPTEFQVAFLDVGQGDATLLRHRDHAILVDSGPPDGPILRRLQALGVRALDVLVITHAQADHDGGAAAVLGAMPVGLLLDGRDGVADAAGRRAARVAGDRGVQRVAGTAGLVLRAGPMTLRVLSPPEAAPASHAGIDPNERAIVALVDDGGGRVLLTADAESPVLGGLDLPTVDILKVAHHGSVDDGLPELLDRLRPRVAGIEVGEHNTYGHPAPATMSTLQRQVPVVVRTDRDGTVTVTRSGSGLAVSRGA